MPWLIRFVDKERERATAAKTTMTGGCRIKSNYLWLEGAVVAAGELQYANRIFWPIFCQPCPSRAPVGQTFTQTPLPFVLEYEKSKLLSSTIFHGSAFYLK
jgi:hypothetical protein